MRRGLGRIDNLGGDLSIEAVLSGGETAQPLFGIDQIRLGLGRRVARVRGPACGRDEDCEAADG
jgi:hypothetical protein